VTLLSGEPKTVAEEAAFAYMDIEAVVAASRRARGRRSG
jgi:hypothetical protein